MGLDCVPLGIAKSGHETEWGGILDRLYAGNALSEDQRERLLEISVPTYDVLDAPTVGTDPAADAWALERKPQDNQESDDEFIRQRAGYRVLDLVVKSCAGLPQYTNAGLYEGVDQTSFRGALLNACEGIIGVELLERAWTDFMRPQEAIDYGQSLLDAAERFRAAGAKVEATLVKPKGLFDRLFGKPKQQPAQSDLSVEDQLDVLDTAGNWYKFWGERGHPIWANY